MRNYIEPLGWEFRYYSLSDELREEVTARGKPVTRPLLHQIANELRRTYGNDILARRVYDRIVREVDYDNVQQMVIIDAIRHPDEVRFFRENLGDEFLLVAIEAPLEVIVERLSLRMRDDEAEEVIRSKSKAKELLQMELGEGEPQYGLGIAYTIRMADYRIYNAGTKEQLRHKAAIFLRDALGLVISPQTASKVVFLDS